MYEIFNISGNNSRNFEIALLPPAIKFGILVRRLISTDYEKVNRIGNCVGISSTTGRPDRESDGEFKIYEQNSFISG
jgi:hypothetical protein